MADWIEIAPPHSLILVVGSRKVEVPQSFNGALIASTDTCIAVGCKAEDDGPSRVSLRSIETVSSADDPAFVGWLSTSDRVVALETVFGERIVEIPTPQSTTRILIWVNDDKEPDEILIGIGG